MCGFFSFIAADSKEFANRFNIEYSTLYDEVFKQAGSLKHYPRSYIATVSKNSPNNLHLRYWQLIPRWYQQDPYRMKFSTFNARSEEIETKATFKIAWKKSQRCLIPMNWFYEFESVDMAGQKQPKKVPYKVSLKESQLFAVAGLYETWYDAEDKPIESCTMLTCPSVDTLNKIHNRQPVIIPEQAWELWLSSNTTPDQAQKMLTPQKDLSVKRIDDRFNKMNAAELAAHPEVIE